MQNGQHLYRTSDGEVVVARSCRDGRTVGFCDVEITRRERPLTLERCMGTRRQLTFGSLTMSGTFGIRVGGVMPEFEVGTVRITGDADISSKAKVLPWLSGPFEPRPDDRIVFVIVEGDLNYEGPTRVSTPSGGSFAVEATEHELLLTDYRPPAGGWAYEPVRVMPDSR